MNDELNIGDRVWVEQAFEDDAGNYRDAAARIEGFDGDELILKFEDKMVDDWLKGCTHEYSQVQKIT